MREVITRYGRHNIGFLWLFLEPMLFTLGVTALWTLTKATHGSRLPIVAFAITGYSSVLLWRNTSSRCLNALEPNEALLFHRNVTPIDVYLSRITLELAGATGSCAALTGIFTLSGMMQPPSDFLTLIVGWLLLCGFALSLGLLIGALSERGEFFDRVWHIVTYLMFPLSGAAFLVEWASPAYQRIILFVPMVHGTEMIREGYFGNIIHAHYDPYYLALVDLILLMAGLTLLRVPRSKIQ